MHQSPMQETIENSNDYTEFTMSDLLHECITDLKRELQSDCMVYIVNRGWWQYFQHCARDTTSESIDAIDNRELLDERNVLKRDMVEGKDFLIFSSTCWKLLSSKIAVVNGSEIIRHIITDKKGTHVELYPPSFSVVRHPPDGPPSIPPIRLSFSFCELVFVVKSEILSALDIYSNANCKWWRRAINSDNFTPLLTPTIKQRNVILSDLNVSDLDTIMVEVCGVNDSYQHSKNMSFDVSALQVGDRVDAKLGEIWRQAEIVAVHNDNRVTVHFVNLEDNWDRVVTANTHNVASLFTRSQTHSRKNAVHNENNKNDKSSVMFEIPSTSSHIERKRKSMSTFTSSSSSSSSSKSFPNVIETNENEPVNSIRRHEKIRMSGVRGLQNLGNTCFMASCLQCLNQTIELKEYFLSDEYLRDINYVNPIGMGGELAKAYGKLVHALWSGQAGSIAPFDIKNVISKHAPMFSGFRQHDSQEFLAFLLDGLHEDLNLITNKPYCIAKDSAGRPDAIVAAEAWDMHQQRNQSKIVDLFQGQLKSTLVCPVCENVSVTFDPFCYLSLPLTSSSIYAINVTMVFDDPRKALVTQLLEVPKDANIQDLIHVVCRYIDVASHRVRIMEVLHGQIHNFNLCERTLVSSITSCDFIFAYIRDDFVCVDNADMCSISLRHVYEHDDENFISSFSSTSTSSFAAFSFPRFRSLPADELTNADVYEYAVQCVQSISNANASITHEDFKLDLKISDQHLPLRFNNESYTHSAAEVIVKWPALLKKRAYKASSDPTHARRATGSEVSMNLEQCIRMFIGEEVLGANDRWFCPCCKEFRRATKKFDLWRLPRVLVVHLKRFQHSTMSRSKLGFLVQFAIEGLNLSSFVIGPHHQNNVYDLFAISNHMGGCGGGHYTAYGKSEEQWYLFDDAHTRPISASCIETRNAYVLFYRLRDV